MAYNGAAGQRNRLASHLEQLNNAISVLTGARQASSRISATGRALIVAAQRARWAKARREKDISIASPSGARCQPPHCRL